MSKYTVIVSDRAKRNLNTHIKFLKNVNSRAALQMKKRIIEAVRSLSDNPQLHPFLKDVCGKLVFDSISNKGYYCICRFNR